MLPALPSTPPPPKEGARPMGYGDALLWTGGITLVLYWLVYLAAAIRSADAPLHPVTILFCEGVAYLFGLFLMLRVHAPEERIRDFVACRATHPLFYLLALVLGVAVAFPANWLVALLYERFPNGDMDELSAIYGAASGIERASMVGSAALLVPVVEETVFRGALFTGLARHGRRPVLGTAILFALVHIGWPLDPPRLAVALIAFVVALAMAELRAASRSIVPCVALHAAVNAVPFAVASWERWPWTWGLGGLVVAVTVAATIRALGSRLGAPLSRRG